MSKKKSAVLFAILAVIVAVFAFFTFASFAIPGSVKNYNSVLKSIDLGIDLEGGVYVVLEPKLAVTDEEYDQMTDEQKKQADEDRKFIADNIDEAQAVLRKRLDSQGYTEAIITRQDSNRIRVEIPAIDDPDAVFDIIGKTAKLVFCKEGADPAKEEDQLLTGDDVKRAYATYDENGSPVVALEFTTAGAKKFSDATASLTGQKMSIYLGEDLVSSPTVNEQISGGKATISNLESFEQAEEYAMLISSGSLNIEFELLEPRVISSYLGEDILNKSLIAGVIGVALVLVFMGVVYRGFGLVADMALVIYILVYLWLVALIPGVQLTLAGIAGVVLSIGMAVDANVIIFERIKDEFRNGKTVTASIRSGYRRALSAIIDSNITTLIAAVVLWWLGTGTVKGFAITLFIGILLSLVTALLVTRALTAMVVPFTKREKFYGLKREADVNE